MNDTLTVSGVGKKFDGVYECDVAELVSISSPDALTVDEARLVKTLSGVRGNEIVEAFLAGDVDLRMALAIVVLGRHGKQLDARMVETKPIGWALFALAPDEETDGDAVPPTTAGELPSSRTPSPVGGESGTQTSDSRQVNDLSPTGIHS